MGKTTYGTVLEGVLSLAFGCDALSYVWNVHQENSLEFDLSFFRRIARWNDFFQRLLPRQALTISGLNAVRSLRHPANVSGRKWYELGISEALDFLQHGIAVFMEDAPAGKGLSLLTASAKREFRLHLFRFGTCQRPSSGRVRTSRKIQSGALRGKTPPIDGTGRLDLGRSVPGAAPNKPCAGADSAVAGESFVRDRRSE